MSTRPRLSSSLGIYHVVYRGINSSKMMKIMKSFYQSFENTSLFAATSSLPIV